MTTRQSQETHDQIALSLARFCAAEGFADIRLDLPGYPRPDVICWTKSGACATPDVTGVSDGVPYLFEVETDDTVSDEHTYAQWRLFAAHAAQTGKRFVVAVPGASVAAAHQRLADLHIRGGEVWALDE